MAKRFTLERNLPRIFQLVVDGLSDSAIAAELSTPRNVVTRQAVTNFRHRHAGELQAFRAQAAEALHHTWIEDKAQRIDRLTRLADQVQAILDDRGMIERTVTTLMTKGGDPIETVRERFARELPAEMRAILRAAAEELAQIERPGSADDHPPIYVGVQLVWANGEPV